MQALFTFYALPSGGKSKDSVVHYQAIYFLTKSLFLHFALNISQSWRHLLRQYRRRRRRRRWRVNSPIQIYFVSIGVGGGVFGYLTLCDAPGGVGGRASFDLLLPRDGAVSGNSSLTLSRSCSMAIGDESAFNDISLCSISKSISSSWNWFYALSLNFIENYF